MAARKKSSPRKISEELQYQQLAQQLKQPEERKFSSEQLQYQQLAQQLKQPEDNEALSKEQKKYEEELIIGRLKCVIQIKISD